LAVSENRDGPGNRPVYHVSDETEFPMVKRITKQDLFKPSKSRSETKADLTDNAARAIIEAEAANRREKTELLRAKRLATSEEKV
jgi:hypothetical protein